MSNRATFRVAPGRAGIRLASIWRFWRQGDEFYAAPRDSIALTKISFHRNENWQVRVGPQVSRLTPRRRVRDEWLHVISLFWLLPADSLIPRSSGNEEVTLLEVPHNTKLILTLLLSTGPSRPSLPDLSKGAILFWEQQLRGGRTLIAFSAIEQETEADRATIARLRREASPITVANIPEPGAFYAEVTWFAMRPESSTLAVVPLSPACLKQDATVAT